MMRDLSVGVSTKTSEFPVNKSLDAGSCSDSRDKVIRRETCCRYGHAPAHRQQGYSKTSKRITKIPCISKFMALMKGVRHINITFT